jgi:hypothetical protein
MPQRVNIELLTRYKHMSPMQSFRLTRNLSYVTRKYYTNLMCNDRPPCGYYLLRRIA